MSLWPVHVWKWWFVFPDLLFHNMSLTNPGIVILESDRAIRKETNITGKTWRMFRSRADLIIWTSNAAETRTAHIITLPPCEAFAMMYASLHPPLFLPSAPMTLEKALIRPHAFIYLIIFYNAPESNLYPPEVALNQVHNHRISHDSLRKRNYSLHQLGFNLLPSETSLSVQWKAPNYLLHSRWWHFFLGSICFLYKLLDDCWKSVCSVSSVILFQCHVSFKV